MDQADNAVWQAVCRLRAEPERLEQDYRPRLLPNHPATEANRLLAQIGKVRRAIARLIDSHAEGLIDPAEFEPRLTRLREPSQQLDNQVQRLQAPSNQAAELRLILSRLETCRAFAGWPANRRLSDPARTHPYFGQAPRGR
jgi:site-specific DNA recombinase